MPFQWPEPMQTTPEFARIQRYQNLQVQETQDRA